MGGGRAGVQPALTIDMCKFCHFVKTPSLANFPPTDPPVGAIFHPNYFFCSPLVALASRIADLLSSGPCATLVSRGEMYE